MTTNQLIHALIERIETIFGPDGSEGTAKEYSWLAETFGVTEEEDNRWADILDPDAAIADWGDDDPSIRTFLESPDAVRVFLLKLLAKYKSCDAIYPRTPR